MRLPRDSVFRLALRVFRVLAGVRRSEATNELETFAGNNLQNEWNHFCFFVETMVRLKASV